MPARREHFTSCIQVRVRAALEQPSAAYPLRYAVSPPFGRLHWGCLDWAAPQRHVRPIRQCAQSQTPTGVSQRLWYHSTAGILLLRGPPRDRRESTQNLRM
jgi:hypothetical protein